jgi:hypothetical protein
VTRHSTVLHPHRVALDKFENNKGIKIKSCLSSVIFPFSSKLIKIAFYLYSSKLKVGSKYLYLTWCAFEHREKIFTNNMMQEKKQRKDGRNWWPAR